MTQQTLSIRLGDRSLTLVCRQCHQPQSFSHEYLWKTPAFALDCPHCHYSACGCYWDQDRKRAKMFAARLYLAYENKRAIEFEQQARSEKQLHSPAGP